MRKSTNSRRSGKSQKPAKPYPDFPLFAHASGRWAKKIRGSLHYFGRWGHKQGSKIVPVDDPEAAANAAVEEYERQRDDLYAGRQPRPKAEGLTVRDLCNQFLTAKEHLLDTGEITDRTFADYHRSCERIVDTLGKHRLVDDLSADDFGELRTALAKTLGPVALGNEIGRMRVVFKFAFDQSLIDRPVRYGQSFNKPSKKTLHQQRAKNGKRLFEADELRRIIEACPEQLKAMTMLAINCGLGQSDCANLPLSALDLENRWMNYPRPKTGVERRCPLWAETVKALRDAIENRPQPKDEADAELVFVTKYGNRWVRTSNHEEPGERVSLDAVSQAFAKVMHSLDINGRRNFYAIRHTFATVASESKDPDAVSSLMGHADNSMAAVYRERISDERLRAVVDVVRGWLFANFE